MKKIFKKLFEDYLGIWKSKYWWKTRLFGLLFACAAAPLAIFVVWPWLEYIVVEKWGFEASDRFLGMASFFVVSLGALIIYLLFKYWIKQDNQKAKKWLLYSLLASAVTFFAYWILGRFYSS